ncbi:MAG: hypothetical protein AB7O96_05745 [Pseudobdellovibrionaceae bacterium]
MRSFFKALIFISGTLGLSACSSTSKSPNQNVEVKMEERTPSAEGKILICKDTENKGVDLTLKDGGYDAEGRIFYGIVYKNEKKIRDTVLRRATVSNYFALYAPGRGGWGVNNDTEDRKGLQMTTESESMRKEIGYSLYFKCDAAIPRAWY